MSMVKEKRCSEIYQARLFVHGSENGGTAEISPGYAHGQREWSVLNRIELRRIVWYCTVFDGTVLCCVVLYSIVLWFGVLRCVYSG